MSQPTVNESVLDKSCKTTFANQYQPYRWSPPNPGYLQLSHMTSEERFPLIFDSAKKLQPNARRILSFGCSTGQECQSLAKRFPRAEIVGVDIDWCSIQTARKNNKSENVFFHTDIGATGSYDLVLALMVFFSMEIPIEYDKFENTLKNIHRHINANGLLMIYTSDYDPAGVPEIAQYSPINVWKRTHNKNNKEYFNGYYRKRSQEALDSLIL